MGKYEVVEKLLNATTQVIKSNKSSWTGFLHTASRMYKYTFDEQVLIYAQKPDVTAVATISIWNRAMNCYVNRGASGIALIDNATNRKLKYVFDVADVTADKRIGRYPKLWKMQKEYQEDVIKHLENIYGKTNDDFNFTDRVIELSLKAAEDYTTEMLPDFKDFLRESSLAERNDNDLHWILKLTLAETVAYTVLLRCGFADADLQHLFKFDHLVEFDTIKSFHYVGDAGMRLVSPILTEIGKVVFKCEERLAKEENVYYNALKHESDKGRHISQDDQLQKEDAFYGTGIRKSRGLLFSETAEGRAADRESDEVRSATAEISGGAQTTQMGSLQNGGFSETALPGNTARSGRENGLDSGTDDESRERKRGAERERADALGTEDEQHPSQGGRNRTERNSVRIEEKNEGKADVKTSAFLVETPQDREFFQMTLFPTQAEQMGDLVVKSAAVKEEKPEIYTLPSDALQRILSSGAGTRHSKIRIYDYWQKNRDIDGFISVLKKEYGTLGKGFDLDGHSISTLFDKNGLQAGYGNSAKENVLVTYTWRQISFEISNMIENGDYLSADEIDAIDEIESERIANSVFFLVSDVIDKEKVFANIEALEKIESTRELIFDKDKRNHLISDLRNYCVGLKLGEIEIRFPYYGINKAQEIIEDLKQFGKERIESARKEYISVLFPSFITQDELDAIYASGSNFVDSVYRIQEFFETNPDRNEQVEFLKKEYGVGGSSLTRGISGQRFGDNHDAKGIRITSSYWMGGNIDVLLSWNNVAKRIEELVAADLYLPEERKEKYERYKEQKLQKSMDRDVPNFGTEQETNQDADEETETVSESDRAKEEAGFFNYKIEDTKHGFGTPKEKYKWNIAAIKTLYVLEEENRAATQDEQDILAKYAGWGGLPDVFDDTKSSWSAEYSELKELLSQKEYESARASTLNAHYTSPIIIESIYSALEQFGFKRGNILEPAMGIGNFFGKLPDSMKGSRLYGVELDDISGRIARKLYPDAKISISGFEDTEFDNAFFDVVIGNVPFGQYSVPDRKYDKYHFMIHDYFFAKSLDLVRAGGVVAFITSKGTMDKQNPAIRKYLAQRAELIGAIRLPNTVFKGNAGTEVTSDIIFLKKRDRIVDIDEEWVHLGVGENDVSMNQYFTTHPEMILGKMEMVSGPYGMESACLPDDTTSFEIQLASAVRNLKASLDFEQSLEENIMELSEDIIPASPDVKNFTYTIFNGKVYYRENSKMFLQSFNEKENDRVMALVGLRDAAYKLINMQMEEYSDREIAEQQEKLNDLYDFFIKKHGSINSRTNKRVFASDSGYSLLCSLEKTNENGEVIGKADMFYKRTIKKHTVATSVDTPAEALALSLGEKAKVDIPYMASLCKKAEDELVFDLEGIIFLNPITDKWETADEYLSGNVREKLKIAKDYAVNDSRFESNVHALAKVQPIDLGASEIDVRLGATWIDVEYINEFMKFLFETPSYLLNGNYIAVNYSEYTGEWNIKGKTLDNRNTLASMTYGTKRASGYRILEDSLNLRDVRIYDTTYEDGKEKRVLNRQETMLACQKQDVIKEKFKEWVYAEPVRRQALCEKYNVLFNSIRPREYDGSHLIFPGMSPDIYLKPHQLNAVARQLYGGNTLLAHCVGAGKTFEICAAAMEKRRLGLCQKNLIVVPNHLTEQWASEFLSLYPGANILAATKKDFEPSNRKKFCSRIATGDYDAVIIGHSQFEKIPLSTERQIKSIESQIEEITLSITDLIAQKGERYSIKQMEKTRKTLEKRLKTLNDAEKKDDVVTFEQLGVDSLFVDESHNYKNLFLYTKMRNVSGVAQTEAKKSSDMYAKCQYIDEITGGTGITFATGTPISNSMTELYTNMRYLQSGMLKRLNLMNFDAWAATFGETQTAIELAPEGTGFRTKTRFAKFYNLPELISLFKEAADVQTADMLNLPVPEAVYENVVLKPSEIQKAKVTELGDRAEFIRAGSIPPHLDNMLKVTNDGRKLALDQRLIDTEYADYENSKANACVERAFEIWESTKEQKSAQLIFCDLSTPKTDGTFNVYTDLKEKLIAKGVPGKEIAFIHDANTDTQKAELFAKVRSGQVRFLVGSTSKMGAGTNVQDRLIALHHLDVPWRPSDIEQQEGRILRQGNQNEKVQIFRYVTEGTFDSYSWQLIENKQRFIGQIMTSKSPVRSCDDVDATALSYAEVKTLSTGNPYIKEKMELDMDVSKLRLMKANHNSQKYRYQDNITQHYPKRIAYLKEKIEGYKQDIMIYRANKADTDNFSMIIQGITLTERKDAGSRIIELAMGEKTSGIFTKLGTYQGLELSCGFDKDSHAYVMRMKGALTHTVEMGPDGSGNITRLLNAYDNMEKMLEKHENELAQVERQLEIAMEEVEKPFPQEEELLQKIERLTELNVLLDMDRKETSVIDEVEAEQEELTDFFELEEHPAEHVAMVKETVKVKL